MLALSSSQLAAFERVAREAFRAELSRALAARWGARAGRMPAERWDEAIAEAEREGWGLGLRDRDGLAAYVEARVVAGARPWPEAIERWLRPGEAAESFRLASFVDAVRTILDERDDSAAG